VGTTCGDRRLNPPFQGEISHRLQSTLTAAARGPSDGRSLPHSRSRSANRAAGWHPAQRVPAWSLGGSVAGRSDGLASSWRHRSGAFLSAIKCVAPASWPRPLRRFAPRVPRVRGQTPALGRATAGVERFPPSLVIGGESAERRLMELLWPSSARRTDAYRPRARHGESPPLRSLSVRPGAAHTRYRLREGSEGRTPLSGHFVRRSSS
jgi:hypothetical protein